VAQEFRIFTVRDTFGSFARSVNNFAASPSATASAFVLVAIWIVSGAYFHFSGVWQLLMTTLSAVVTFLMVFVLNNAQSRDTAAINAKLDSIIFAMEDADNRLIGVESKSESHAQAVIEDMKTTVEEAQTALVEAESALETASESLPKEGAEQHA
jgi:low affinity Fe/Cu permease